MPWLQLIKLEYGVERATGSSRALATFRTVLLVLLIWTAHQYGRGGVPSPRGMPWYPGNEKTDPPN